MKAIPAHWSFFQMMQVLPPSGQEEMQINKRLNNQDEGAIPACARLVRVVGVGTLLESISLLSSFLTPLRSARHPQE